MNNKITFVNGVSKCGCVMAYSDGGGEYSDVHEITPCPAHAQAGESNNAQPEPFGYYSGEVPIILEQQGHANISRDCTGEYILPLYTVPPAAAQPIDEDMRKLRRNKGARDGE